MWQFAQAEGRDEKYESPSPCTTVIVARPITSATQNSAASGQLHQDASDFDTDTYYDDLTTRTMSIARFTRDNSGLGRAPG